MADDTKVPKRRPCKKRKTGLVAFDVKIIVDRNALVKDSEGGEDHNLMAWCFPIFPKEEPRRLEISPLKNIEKHSRPEQKEILRKRVNARALVSLLLALADAEFEAVLCELKII